MKNKKKKPFTLAFYLRSGNVVRAHNVIDWTIHYTDNTITGVTINRSGIDETSGLIVKSIALDQIEAIAKEPA